MLFFTFIEGGVTPLTGPPNLDGFSSIIRGGGVKSLLPNVNKKMVFFNEGFPNSWKTIMFWERPFFWFTLYVGEWQWRVDRHGRDQAWRVSVPGERLGGVPVLQDQQDQGDDQHHGRHDRDAEHAEGRRWRGTEGSNMIQILVSLSKMKFRRGLQLRMGKTTVGSKQM